MDTPAFVLSHLTIPTREKKKKNYEYVVCRMACQTLHYSIFLFDLNCHCIFLFNLYSLLLHIFVSIVCFSFLFYIRSFVFNICLLLLYMFRFYSIFDHLYLIINNLYAKVFHYNSISVYLYSMFYICV